MVYFCSAEVPPCWVCSGSCLVDAQLYGWDATGLGSSGPAVSFGLFGLQSLCWSWIENPHLTWSPARDDPQEASSFGVFLSFPPGAEARLEKLLCCGRSHPFVEQGSVWKKGSSIFPSYSLSPFCPRASTGPFMSMRLKKMIMLTSKKSCSQGKLYSSSSPGQYVLVCLGFMVYKVVLLLTLEVPQKWHNTW